MMKKIIHMCLFTRKIYNVLTTLSKQIFVKQKQFNYENFKSNTN